MLKTIAILIFNIFAGNTILDFLSQNDDVCLFTGLLLIPVTVVCNFIMIRGKL
jgi:hypothetical protein